MFNFEADDTNEKHNVEYKYFDLTFSRNGGGPAGGAHRDNSKFNSTIFFCNFSEWPSTLGIKQIFMFVKKNIFAKSNLEFNLTWFFPLFGRINLFRNKLILILKIITDSDMK